MVSNCVWCDVRASPSQPTGNIEGAGKHCVPDIPVGERPKTVIHDALVGLALGTAAGGGAGWAVNGLTALASWTTSVAAGGVALAGRASDLVADGRTCLATRLTGLAAAQPAALGPRRRRGLDPWPAGRPDGSRPPALPRPPPPLDWHQLVAAMALAAVQTATATATAAVVAAFTAVVAATAAVAAAVVAATTTAAAVATATAATTAAATAAAAATTTAAIIAAATAAAAVSSASC